MATKTTEKADPTTTTAGAAHASRPAFRASEQLAGHLEQLLVDLTELHLQGKQAHWNVVGRNFRDLHLQLDEIVDAARDFTDEVAERMRALYVTPDARSATVAERTTLVPFPAREVDTALTVDLIAGALYASAGTARRIHDDVDAEDPTTADLLHAIITRLEQLAWMVDAENRVANESTPAQVNA
jgi:starvation-inducible DNA-binding protein